LGGPTNQCMGYAATDLSHWLTELAACGGILAEWRHRIDVPQHRIKRDLVNDRVEERRSATDDDPLPGKSIRRGSWNPNRDQSRRAFPRKYAFPSTRYVATLPPSGFWIVCRPAALETSPVVVPKTPPFNGVFKM
jgi:hypothetical protein